MIVHPSKKRSIDRSSTNATEEPILFLRVKRRRSSSGGCGGAANAVVAVTTAAACDAQAAPVWTTTTTTTNVLVLRVGFFDDGSGTDATTAAAALSKVTLQQQQHHQENDCIPVATMQHNMMMPSDPSQRSQCHVTNEPQKSATAVFRRVTNNGVYYNLDDTTRSISGGGGGDFHNNGRRHRILDAVLLEADTDEESPRSFSGHSNNNNKRRKLTLQLLGPSNKHDICLLPPPRRSSILEYPVWSPEQRAVDDSLQQVFQGVRSLHMHCDFIHTTTFATAGMDDDDDDDGSGIGTSSTTSLWAWMWCHAESGNWLHAAALWNESELVTTEVSRWRRSLLLPPQEQSQQQQLIRHLIEAVDGEGRTPVAVAQMAGHEAVQQVLESLAVEAYHSPRKEQDDAYDLYCLMPDFVGQSGGEQTNEEHNDGLVLDCELHDGCKGYWDDRGELVLEPLLPVGSGVDNNDNAFENSSSDDEDSNREAWNGNDYPDDDEGDDHWSCSTTGDASYGNQLDTDFRQRPANIMYGSDDEDYDPAYGLF